MSLAEKTPSSRLTWTLPTRLSTVATSGGPARSLAKLVADNQAAIEAAVATVSGADASLIAYDGGG